MKALVTRNPKNKLAAKLRALAVELSLVEDRERRSLARDLHDDVSQILAVTKIKLKSIEKLEKVNELKDRLNEVYALLDRVHLTIRSMTFQLSPPLLNELGFIPALQWLANEMHKLYGLHVTVTEDGKRPHISFAVSVILFRAVRELLINVAKHAKVTTAKINVKHTSNYIHIFVEDDGVGVDKNILKKQIKNQQSNQFGIMNICERMHYLGGKMLIHSKQKSGTCVDLHSPLILKKHANKKTQSKKTRAKKNRKSGGMGMASG